MIIRNDPGMSFPIRIYIQRHTCIVDALRTHSHIIAGISWLVAPMSYCRIFFYSHPTNVGADALTLSKLNIVCHPIHAPCGVIFQFHMSCQCMFHEQRIVASFFCEKNNIFFHFFFLSLDKMTILLYSSCGQWE